jgi:hypothetical protein
MANKHFFTKMPKAVVKKPMSPTNVAVHAEVFVFEI